MVNRRQKIKDVVMENRLLKLLALISSFMVIYAIQQVTNQLDEFEVPIVIHKESGIAVLSQDARTAYVTGRGSLDDLKRLDPERLRVEVSPKGIDIAGTEQIPIGPRNVQGIPRGVSITKVRPGVINVTFDREIMRTVNIAKPELVGHPLLGHAEVDYDPKLATVRGPEQQLGNLKILRTNPIDVDGAVDSFTTEVRILTDAGADAWDISPARITARVSIVTESIEREWPQLPVSALRGSGKALQLTLNPEHVDFSVLGSPQAVNRIELEDIRVFVDCSNIDKPGAYSLPVLVYLRDGADVSTAVNPSMVNVQAEERMDDDSEMMDGERDLDPTEKPASSYREDAPPITED